MASYIRDAEVRIRSGALGSRQMIEALLPILREEYDADSSDDYTLFTVNALMEFFQQAYRGAHGRFDKLAIMTNNRMQDVESCACLEELAGWSREEVTRRSEAITQALEKYQDAHASYQLPPPLFASDAIRSEVLEALQEIHRRAELGRFSFI